MCVCVCLFVAQDSHTSAENLDLELTTFTARNDHAAMPGDDASVPLVGGANGRVQRESASSSSSNDDDDDDDDGSKDQKNGLSSFLSGKAKPGASADDYDKTKNPFFGD